ncbi:MAG: hypothetical protein Q8R74_02580 [Methylophilus sp.]|nr:hypothetical protein [Methylophilus sp.]MDP3607945.1 hypothetical protein [Methylophilus sp.]
MNYLSIQAQINMKSLLSLGLCIFPLSNLNAMEFTKGFYFPVSVNYDSNLQMDDQNKESVSFYNATPRVTLVGQDGVNTVSFDGSVLFQKSSNDQISENRKDPTLGLSWLRDFSRGQFSLSTNYSKLSTRISEQRRTGQVFADGSAINKSIDANLSYLLSDKFNLATGIGYQESNFSGAQLNDFSAKTFNTRLNYLYSEKLTPFAQFSISRFENESNNINNLVVDNFNNDGSTVSRNFLLGFNYLAGPKTDFTMAAGMNRLSTGDNGWVGNASIRHAINDQSNVSGTLSRAIVPTGLGGFDKIDNMGVIYAYDIDQKNHLGTDFNWTINRAINDSKFKILNGFYAYDITEKWGVRTYAQFRNLEANNVDVNAYQVGFSFSYNHPNF